MKGVFVILFAVLVSVPFVSADIEDDFLDFADQIEDMLPLVNNVKLSVEEVNGSMTDIPPPLEYRFDYVFFDMSGIPLLY